MRVLDVLKEAPRECSYLSEKTATLEHRILLDVTALELESMLERGWRRFGPDYFRPQCPGCSDCIPTRIPTAKFRASKSQMRALKKCGHLAIRVGAPKFDEERLLLYHRWHRYREETRGWGEAELGERSYRVQFSFPHPAAREVTFWEPESGRLVGVALSDETPQAWSAIYFFYEPELAHLSLGTANVVTQVEIARERRIPYLYLGYRVPGCPSLEYKGSFRPQERLVGWPEDDEQPTWVVST